MMTTLLDDDFLTSVKNTIDEIHYNMSDIYNYTTYKASKLPYMAPNEPAISSYTQLSQNNQRYKIGDRVRVISKELYDMHKHYDTGDAIFKNDTLKFVKHMSCFCGMQAYITNVISNDECWIYRIDIDGGKFYWTDNMLEDVNEKCMMTDIMNMLDSLSNRLTNIENDLASIIRKLDPNEKENTI